MMKTPFTDIDKAFEPFWIDMIIATLKNGETQTLPCCVFDDVEGEPLVDNMMDTDRRDILIMARDADWCFIKRMKRGDELTYNNEKYSVKEAKNDSALGIIVRARQV